MQFNESLNLVDDVDILIAAIERIDDNHTVELVTRLGCAQALHGVRVWIKQRIRRDPTMRCMLSNDCFCFEFDDWEDNGHSALSVKKGKGDMGFLALAFVPRVFGAAVSWYVTFAECVSEKFVELGDFGVAGKHPTDTR
jgi:hypothetical protein